MAAAHDHWLDLARRIIAGLAGKPGFHFADKKMAADYLAQQLAAAERRGEVQRGK